MRSESLCDHCDAPWTELRPDPRMRDTTDMALCEACAERYDSGQTDANGELVKSDLTDANGMPTVKGALAMFAAIDEARAKALR